MTSVANRFSSVWFWFCLQPNVICRSFTLENLLPLQTFSIMYRKHGTGLLLIARYMSWFSPGPTQNFADTKACSCSLVSPEHARYQVGQISFRYCIGTIFVNSAFTLFLLGLFVDMFSTDFSIRQNSGENGSEARFHLCNFHPFYSINI